MILKPQHDLLNYQLLVVAVLTFYEVFGKHKHSEYRYNSYLNNGNLQLLEPLGNVPPLI